MLVDTFKATQNKVVVGPLRKRTLQGKLYVRIPSVEAKLREILALPPTELVNRCALLDRKDPAYIHSECLLYLVRTWKPDDPYFEQIYKILAERILRRIPKGQMREKLFESFVDLLAQDRTTYIERLDYFEVRFDSALLNMRRDAQRWVCREPDHSSIDDPEMAELRRKAEECIGSFDPFDPATLDRADYRSRLDEAINTLPIEQKEIVELWLQGMPIDSSNPSTMSIAKKLGKAEKTIRLHRDQAFATLRSILENEKMS
jgi:hypothetical protein